MATIRKLRSKWQAQVRRRGVAPRAKSFDKRADAERWARELEAEADRSGWVADTRLAERTTLRELLTRYCTEVTPGKRGAVSERSRINSILRSAMSHRTLAKLTSADVAMYRDERLSVSPQPQWFGNSTPYPTPSKSRPGSGGSGSPGTQSSWCDALKCPVVAADD